MYEDGTKERKFSHALIAGIERYPRKVTRKHEKELTAEARAKRMTVRPFVKFVNFQHILPTRYNLDISEALERAVGEKSLVEEKNKKEVTLDIKNKLEARYKTMATGKNEKAATAAQYFFKKLKF